MIDNNITDEPTPADLREADFNRTFTWRGKPLAITIAGEMYYRDLRTLCAAPALSSYQTLGDFAPEASRVLYCASLDYRSIQDLRRLPSHLQVEAWEQWVEKNIAFNELDLAARTAQDMQQVIARVRTRPLDTDGDTIDGSGN